MKNKQIFNLIRYSNVWEDADILCKALAPAAQKRILSIASSGDNVLALLTLDPEEIVAVDLSPPQLACLEVRIAGFRKLEYSELLPFLGVLPSQHRVKTYKQRLRGSLSEDAKTFFDDHLALIERGLIHTGKFEKYLKTFGKWVLPLIHSRSTIGKLLVEMRETERLSFYEKKWDTWRWRLLFKLFFSRTMMGRLGRDPSFLNHVEGTVASQILARSKSALTKSITHKNPYLHYILKGNFSKDSLPLYLRECHFETIRSKLSRIKLHLGPLEGVEGLFDGFNLSDAFEYMSEDEFVTCYKKIIDRANPMARIAYWNLLVNRSCPKSCKPLVEELKEESLSLHKLDKAWFYQKFIVEMKRP